MGWGWGCWERILLQLRHYKITKPQLHRYLHDTTRLASFLGLDGVHLDIKDLAFLTQ